MRDIIDDLGTRPAVPAKEAVEKAEAAADEQAPPPPALLDSSVFPSAEFHRSPWQHRLTPEANEIFFQFYNDHRRHTRRLAPDLQRFAVRRPEQVLKIALLLHLTSEDRNAEEIQPVTLGAAIAIATRLGNRGMTSAAVLFGPPPFTIELEVQKMVTKLTITGPLRKRDLFRRYNDQDYRRLDPILQQAIEANQIRVDGELLCPVNT